MVVSGGRLAPDGFPVGYPMGQLGWLWLAANLEVAADDDSEVHELVPVLADMEPPATPEEEETLF